MATDQKLTVTGVVDRVTYSNDESSWSVVQLTATDIGPFTAVGSLFGVQPGERLRLDGRWIQSPRWGRQFEVSSFLALRPETERGIELYLASGVVRGIGPALARRLVAAFGLETLDVIADHPRRLDQVEGIGKVRRQRILEAWKQQSEIRNIMIFLQSHGISSHHAAKIFKHYGNRSVSIVRENPFRLARDVFGIGFASADLIAERLGIPADAPQRIEAGALESLFLASKKGHTFLPRSHLVNDAAELLETVPTQVEDAIDRLVQGRHITAVETARGEAIYPRALESAERELAKRLRLLVERGSERASHGRQLDLEPGRALAWFEERAHIELAPSQREAATRAFTNPAMVITGGPGTGKTTLMQCVVEVLARKGARVELAAPTGRAAKRLAEATGRPARTLHRLLEFEPRSGLFKRREDNPLECNLLVIDEISMIDIALAHHLVKALPAQCHLLLVGDDDQLPSVGPGRVLADLIDSGILAVARLTEVFRQAKESQIVVNAHRINAGLMPVASESPRSSDFFFIERDDADTVISTLTELLVTRIPRSFGFDVRHDVQLLTPMRGGRLGTDNLNQELQALLNPRGSSLNRAGRILRIGDRVMQLRNNYDLDVFNGDIGHVREIDSEDQVVRVDIDGRIVCYEKAHLDELTLAYACSVHKSQGSEFPCAIVILHTQHFPLLQRNLLYTALTRGRELVILLGSRRAVATAVRNIDTSRRNTLLVERLQGAIPD